MQEHHPLCPELLLFQHALRVCQDLGQLLVRQPAHTVLSVQPLVLQEPLQLLCVRFVQLGIGHLSARRRVLDVLRARGPPRLEPLPLIHVQPVQQVLGLPLLRLRVQIVKRGRILLFLERLLFSLVLHAASALGLLKDLHYVHFVVLDRFHPLLPPLVLRRVFSVMPDHGLFPELQHAAAAHLGLHLRRSEPRQWQLVLPAMLVPGLALHLQCAPVVPLEQHHRFMEQHLLARAFSAH